MGLDIRLPIGFLFSIFGVLLIAYGLLSDPAIYQRSLGININLEWGIVMLFSAQSCSPWADAGRKFKTRADFGKQQLPPLCHFCAPAQLADPGK